MHPTGMFSCLVYLLSATKLRRLCFHRHVSVHRGMPGPGRCLLREVPGPGVGGACSQGCLLRGGSGPGGAWSWGCLLLEGACSQMVPAPGGLVSQHALRQTPPESCRRHASYLNAFLFCILFQFLRGNVLRRTFRFNHVIFNLPFVRLNYKLYP